MIPNIGETIKDIQKDFLIQEETFKTGSVIRIFYKIIEGKRERVQIFEGTVIDIHGQGVQRMVKVRKMVGQIGVERTFPLHSPKIQKIEFVRQGKARRAKLFYLRDRIGKKAQLKTVAQRKDQ